jgi:hypothetical protein
LGTKGLIYILRTLLICRVLFLKLPFKNQGLFPLLSIMAIMILLKSAIGEKGQ